MSSSPIRPNDNLGKTPKEQELPFNIKDLTPESIQQIRDMVKDFDDMTSPFEKKMREEQKQRQLLYEKKLREAIEKAAYNEEIEIPLKSGKFYRFIGYDSDQYIELNKIGTEADNMPDKEKGSEKYLKLELEVYRKMVKYSLDNIPQEVIQKLPKNQLYWFYLVCKEKNDNPLPFVQSG